MIGNKDTDLSLFEFQSKFTSDRDCIEYLSTMKWSKGFECKKCKHTHYCKGVKEFDRQCTRCRSIELNFLQKSGQISLAPMLRF